jgi:CheY-like chemotaxis protein
MSDSKKKILIVDDSPLIIDRLTELLQELFYVETIISAADYDEAIEMLGKENIDIAFLDIHLPGKNGIALLQFIKANYAGIKVIMLSNQASSYYRMLCKKKGASHFVDKSKEFESIPELLSSFN